MKKESMLFVLAAVIGYASFMSLTDRRPSAATAAASAEQASKANTSRVRQNDAIAAYEEIMLDEEQKLQLAIHQANRLSELLGLAERTTGSDGSEQIAAKLATLFPKEALDYYITCPTDAEMNQEMYRSIVYEWAARDWHACLAYLNSSATVTDQAFRQWWERLAKNHFENNPEDCRQMFQGLSPARQQDLVEKADMPYEMMSALLPLLKDAAFVAKTEGKIARVKQHHEAREKDSLLREQSGEAKETKRAEELERKWRYESPPTAEVVAELKEMKSRDHRKRLLQASMEPRAGTGEDTGEGKGERPQEWLVRISALMTEVGEIPDYPPSIPNINPGGNDTYSPALAEWLPQQEPRLQRAWAENIFDSMSNEEAFSYIQKLSTESLRADMRDKQWSNWTSEDGEEAAAAMIQQATPTELEANLPNAVYQWAVRDYASAKQWLDAQADSPAKSAALKKLQP